jgi:actin-related protein 2
LLFNPHFDGHDYKGAPEMVFDCINLAPIDLRKELYDKIIISGGTSMFPGFPTRFYN